MSTRVKVALMCAMVLGLLVAERSAFAQDFEAAERHFAAGQDAFTKKRFHTAAAEFTAAYDFTKDPILLYNVGESWQKAGEGRRAVEAYEAYLKLQPNAADRTEVSGRAKFIIAHDYKIPDQSSPDDHPKVVSPMVRPGKAAVAKAAVAKPVAPVVAPPNPAVLPPELETPKHEVQIGISTPTRQTPLKLTAWIGVALTVALVTTGGIMGLAAQSRADEITRRREFVDATGQPHPYDASASSAEASLKSDGRLYNGLSIGFFSAAGAAAVVTTTLFIVDAMRNRPSKRAQISPIAGPHGGGLVAGWHF